MTRPGDHRAARLNGRWRRCGAGLALAVIALVLTAGCGGEEPPPRVCQDLAAATDITGIGQAVDNVAPGHDYSANELQAEPAVQDRCPDQAYKLQRYREQVLNPVAGG